MIDFVKASSRVVYLIELNRLFESPRRSPTERTYLSASQFASQALPSRRRRVPKAPYRSKLVARLRLLQAPLERAGPIPHPLRRRNRQHPIEQLDGDGKVQVGNHATPRAQPRVGRDQTQESPVLGAHHGATARP